MKKRKKLQKSSGNNLNFRIKLLTCMKEEKDSNKTTRKETIMKENINKRRYKLKKKEKPDNERLLRCIINSPIDDSV